MGGGVEGKIETETETVCLCGGGRGRESLFSKAMCPLNLLVHLGSSCSQGPRPQEGTKGLYPGPPRG